MKITKLIIDFTLFFFIYYLCIFLHELGHAFVLICNDVDIITFHVGLEGGFVQYIYNPNVSNYTYIIMSLMGSIVAFIFSVIFMILFIKLKMISSFISAYITCTGNLFNLIDINTGDLKSILYYSSIEIVYIVQIISIIVLILILVISSVLFYICFIKRNSDVKSKTNDKEYTEMMIEIQDYLNT